MKTTVRATAFAIVIVTALYPALSSRAQRVTPSKQCSRPATLKLLPGQNGEPNYIIGERTYPGYPLDELRKILDLPGCQRPLYVLIDYRVPVGYVPSAAAPKLQVENVRYFIQYPGRQGENLVEIKIDHDSALPKIDTAP